MSAPSINVLLLHLSTFKNNITTEKKQDISYKKPALIPTTNQPWRCLDIKPCLKTRRKGTFIDTYYIRLQKQASDLLEQESQMVLGTDSVFCMNSKHVLLTAEPLSVSGALLGLPSVTENVMARLWNIQTPLTILQADEQTVKQLKIEVCLTCDYYV
ncbi:hypothetical protein LEMLEM_LOCUS25510 [Lemmus lemmus]